MRKLKQSTLVEGTFFKVNYYAFAPASLYVKRTDNRGPNLMVIKENEKPKLVDIKGAFIEQLDPFNSQMVAEFQNCVNFAINVLLDLD